MITEAVANQVLAKLDGWVLIDPTDLGDPDPYPGSNNIVTLEEVDDAWGDALSDAKLHIKNNPQVLETALIRDFWKAVILWAASKLWRKYNHTVESPGQEGVTNDSRGKDLYFDGKRILDKLQNSILYGLS